MLKKKLGREGRIRSGLGPPPSHSFFFFIFIDLDNFKRNKANLLQWSTRILLYFLNWVGRLLGQFVFIFEFVAYQMTDFLWWWWRGGNMNTKIYFCLFEGVEFLFWFRRSQMGGGNFYKKKTVWFLLSWKNFYKIIFIFWGAVIEFT